MKAAKVKGHATYNDISEGMSGLKNKAGNDKVDQIADNGIQQGYDEGMQELTAFFAGQRKETKAVIVRLQKAILRVLRAEHKHRTDQEERMMKEQKALHGKNAGKITLPQQYLIAQAEAGVHAGKVEISRPRSNELEAQTKTAAYMIFAFICFS